MESMYSVYIIFIIFQILHSTYGLLILNVEPNQCLVIIVRDGSLSDCSDVFKTLTLDREIIGRYTETLVFLHKKNRTTIDAHLYFNKTMFPKFYDEIEKQGNQIVKHLWPNRNEVITSNTFSISFHDALSRDLCVYINPIEEGIVVDRYEKKRRIQKKKEIEKKDEDYEEE